MHSDKAHDVEAAPARAPRRDAERNRRRIIEAAREVFALRGLDAGFNEIARHAGLGVGTVYRRFPDKETLVEAVLEDDVTALADLIEEFFHTADAWDGLRGLLHVVAQHQVTHRGLRDAILGSPHHRQYSAAFRTRVGPRMVALIQRAQREGSLRRGVSIADFMMILLMVGELGPAGEAVCPGAHRRYLDLFLESLKAEPGRPALEPGITEVQAQAIMRHLATARVRR
jgi:AcrR family transcriptional regulator